MAGSTYQWETHLSRLQCILPLVALAGVVYLTILRDQICQVPAGHRSLEVDRLKPGYANMGVALLRQWPQVLDSSIARKGHASTGDL